MLLAGPAITLPLALTLALSPWGHALREVWQCMDRAVCLTPGGRGNGARAAARALRSASKRHMWRMWDRLPSSLLKSSRCSASSTPSVIARTLAARGACRSGPPAHPRQPRARDPRLAAGLFVLRLFPAVNLVLREIKGQVSGPYVHNMIHMQPCCQAAWAATANTCTADGSPPQPRPPACVPARCA